MNLNLEHSHFESNHNNNRQESTERPISAEHYTKLIRTDEVQKEVPGYTKIVSGGKQSDKTGLISAGIYTELILVMKSKMRYQNIPNYLERRKKEKLISECRKMSILPKETNCKKM